MDSDEKELPHEDLNFMRQFFLLRESCGFICLLSYGWTAISATATSAASPLMAMRPLSVSRQ